MLNERLGYFSRFWRLMQARAQQPGAEKLYRAIVAQTRLKAFYETLGVPDTLQGRYFVLSLHLFAVLYRLRQLGEDGRPLAQDLVDRFAADMDTVLREQGVSDLRVPKTVRGVSATFEGFCRRLEPVVGGEAALAEELAADLSPDARAVSVALATYLNRMISSLAETYLAALAKGDVRFPPVQPADGGKHA
jgi:cytochrome b pre-mRNA-processing protein 3